GSWTSSRTRRFGSRRSPAENPKRSSPSRTPTRESTIRPGRPMAGWYCSIVSGRRAATSGCWTAWSEVLMVLLLAVLAATWPQSTPQAEGLDRAVLQALDRALAAGKHGYVDSMLVLRNGTVVHEKSYDHSKDYRRLFKGKGAPGIYNYYDPGWHPFYKGTQLHTMQSVSKSVTSALIGIAIRRGESPSVAVKVMPSFAELEIPPDPLRDRMTLSDVLTMRTGIRWDEESTEYTDPANNCAVME